MPRLPKTDTPLDRKHGRKPVRRVPKPGMQTPSIRANPGRSNRAARQTATAAGTIAPEPAALPIEAATNQANSTPDRLTSALSADTLAAAAAMDAQTAPEQVANSEPGQPAIAPSGAAPGLSVDQCVADARELIEWTWSTVKALDVPIPPRTLAVLEQKPTREQIATATGRLFHHYGITGTDIVSNPWAGLAMALSPVAFALFLDYREAAAQAAANADAPPTVAADTLTAQVASATAPPSPLATRA